MNNRKYLITIQKHLKNISLLLIIYLTKVPFTNNHIAGTSERRKQRNSNTQGCVLGEIINDTSSVSRGPLL